MAIKQIKGMGSTDTHILEPTQSGTPEPAMLSYPGRAHGPTLATVEGISLLGALPR